jgi:hypothetical protein
MKNSSLIKLAAGICCLLFAGILLLKNRQDADALTLRLKDYNRKTDSLRMAVKYIDKNVHQKDSILMIYLVSLDHTFEELNKESAKNKRSIEANLLKQDSVRKAYCTEMARLKQHPEDCQ